MGGNLLWSTAANWTNGLPDSTKVALFDGNFMNGSNSTCTFNSAVQAANKTVAGIQTTNQYSGSLELLSSGGTLTVSSVNGDTQTGLKWGDHENSTPTLSIGTDAVLNITGGGDGTYNKWSHGILGSTTALGNVYVNALSTLRVTLNAFNLGANITIGQDGDGGSTLEFNGQTAAVGVRNSAFIKVADNTDVSQNGPNHLLFNGDATVLQSYGIERVALANNIPYIDNFGTIIRSNSGTYKIGLPIRNNDSVFPATLKLESNLRITETKDFTNTESFVSVYQAAGEINIHSAKDLMCRGVLMAGGILQGFGGGGSISKDTGFTGTLLTVTGGTIKISDDDPTQFGSLVIHGNMIWTGGTYQAIVNGGTAAEQTQLDVRGNLTLSNNAHLNINVVGAVTPDLVWSPIKYTGTRAQQLTFDSGAAFTIIYNDVDKLIDVRSR